MPTIDVIIPDSELNSPIATVDERRSILLIEMPKINHGSINHNTNVAKAKIKYLIHVRKLKRNGVKDHYYKLGKKLLTYSRVNRYKFKEVESGIYSVRYRVIITRGKKVKYTKWSGRTLVHM